MQFPNIPEEVRITRLQPPTGKISIVIDTDTFNEIDDQFAIAHAMLSPDQLTVEAIYAAPYFNKRSDSPADGMEKSYDEILRLLDRLNYSHENFVYKGSLSYLGVDLEPVDSAAARDLVARAMARSEDDPLYVVAIGVITNVVSAIMMEPEIIKRIVVVWLGGHALHWHHTIEFNLKQDVPASRILFDCGVPLVQIPCQGVTSHLFTTLSEMNEFVLGRGAIGDFLVETYKGYFDSHFGRSKVIWDIATTAWLINPNWVPTNLIHSPILTDQVTWSVDTSRHLIRYATYIHRDPIFADLFKKLEDNHQQ